MSRAKILSRGEKNYSPCVRVIEIHFSARKSQKVSFRGDFLTPPPVPKGVGPFLSDSFHAKCGEMEFIVPHFARNIFLHLESPKIDAKKTDFLGLAGRK